DATAVSDATQNIYLEAAFWWPKAVAGRSRRFNFSTDAGHRFERGVDPSQTVEHLERITQLIIDICGTADTVCGPIDDQQVNIPVAPAVNLRVARASKVIGMPLSQAQCADALARLGLAITQSEGIITVAPPSYRFDLQIEEDLIEEVARMVGYNNLPQTPPLAPITAKIRPETQRSPFALRRSIAALGYQETINFSFVEERWEHELCANPNPIKLLNPIASQMSVMRSSLLGSLLQVLKFNLDRKAQRVRVFELGRVFLRDASVKNTDATVEGLDQPMRVAGLVCGSADELQWGHKERPVDFFDIKGDVETLLAPRHCVFEPAQHPAMHPGRCARVLLDGMAIGFVGELHPKWRQAYDLAQAPLMFELELDALLQREVPVFTSVAKHQAVERDIAVMVNENVTHAALRAAIGSAPTAGLLRNAVLFDIYRPKSAKDMDAPDLAKSYAIRLTFNGEDATLTEEQIDNATQAVLASLVSQLGARQRT
ncbi:phenylalanine--tRNA ligase subunit beta, partial [Rhodoferax sp.]|uniref:phenylalanine--tRNA ligase subunit beta n=1 Tax=Rhodoferax sp. TaxID=50421 RepID=UPI00374DBD09